MRVLCNVALTLVMLAALAAPASAFCADRSAREIADEAAESIVTISVFDATGKKEGDATGFFVEKGRVLTHAHFLEDAASVEISGARKTYSQATLSKLSENLNLALLVVENAEESSLELAIGGSVYEGQRVVAVGNPLDFESAYSEGVVSALNTGEGEEDLELLRITAAVSPASSGGPLLDMQGEVVGLASYAVIEGEEISFAIGVDSIRLFMRMPSDPKVLLPAGERVIWKTIIHWIVKGAAILLGLAAIISSGGWAVLAVAFMVVAGLAKVLLRALIALRDRARERARARSQKRLPPP